MRVSYSTAADLFRQPDLAGGWHVSPRTAATTTPLLSSVLSRKQLASSVCIPRTAVYKSRKCKLPLARSAAKSAAILSPTNPTSSPLPPIWTFRRSPKSFYGNWSRTEELRCSQLRHCASHLLERKSNTCFNRAIRRLRLSIVATNAAHSGSVDSVSNHEVRRLIIHKITRLDSPDMAQAPREHKGKGKPKGPRTWPADEIERARKNLLDLGGAKR